MGGVSVLVVAFLFHWIGHWMSVLNWDLAARSGLQEEALLPAYKVYGHAIATAGVALGWICGIARLGLLMDTRKGYKLAWFPGEFLEYHCISYQF